MDLSTDVTFNYRTRTLHTYYGRIIEVACLHAGHGARAASKLSNTHFKTMQILTPTTP